MSPPPVIFCDRQGGRESLQPFEGETLYSLLVRHFIPPSSVIVLRDSVPVADGTPIHRDRQYEAHLIEGYDIKGIREAYRKLTSAQTNGNSPSFSRRHLGFGMNGSLDTEQADLSLEELSADVEQRVIETLRQFHLIRAGDKIVVGLSGGVDSSSLLLILKAATEQIDFQMEAITFEDFDSRSSSTFRHAHQLAKEFDLQHNLIPAKLIEQTFHLNTSLHAILEELMTTSVAHLVMYIDHHTTRRALEVYAKTEGIGIIALGLHTTDLIAGLLNGWTTGYYVADLPKRTVGDVNYIYPLAFISKRELHLYHLHKTGALARHSQPNQWELFPQDRNYYYYLADELQRLWPGMEDMLFTAHNWRVKKDRPPKYEVCCNCGSHVLGQADVEYKTALCDVCLTLRAHGYISE